MMGGVFLEDMLTFLFGGYFLFFHSFFFFFIPVQSSARAS